MSPGPRGGADMRYVSLKGFPIPISAVGFGTWPLGGPVDFAGAQVGLGPADERESLLALEAALAAGVNFFDTADTYGRSESLLGEALKGAGEGIVVCGKCGNREKDGKAVKDFGPAWIQESVERSLRKLGRERLEILLLHGPPDDFPWEAWDFSALDGLVSRGTILAYGISCRSVAGALNFARNGRGMFVEGIYNILDRRMEDAVFPLLREKGMGFIARTPLAQGFLAGAASKDFPASDIRSSLPEGDAAWRRQARAKLAFLDAEPGGIAAAALRFCLGHPDIATVIPGMRTRAQVRENLAAAAYGPLGRGLCEAARAAVPEPYAGWTGAKA